MMHIHLFTELKSDHFTVYLHLGLIPFISGKSFLTEIDLQRMIMGPNNSWYSKILPAMAKC